MSRTNAAKLVLEAKGAGTAVGAFNVILLEHAEALVAGAEQAKLPVILQISENCVSYHKALKPISVATIAIAESSTVPVSVHLDHAESEELVKEALDLGYDSIMFDGSKLSYADNVAASARMAALCKSYGATLEVEIGEVGGKDGVHAPGVRTNPLEAKAFAEATGADLLAVAVGSSHAMTTRDATLDFALIQEIAKTVSVPLVLHGSSGVSDSDLQKAVKAGMSKINIATHLNNVFTHEIRQALDSNPKLVDPRKYIAPGRDAVATEVARLLILLSLTS
jgi:fructose-bisphosphate aldolase, class II